MRVKTISFHTIPCHFIPHHITPHHITPYHTTPYHIVVPYTIPYHTCICLSACIIIALGKCLGIDAFDGAGQSATTFDRLIKKQPCNSTLYTRELREGGGKCLSIQNNFACSICILLFVRLTLLLYLECDTLRT